MKDRGHNRDAQQCRIKIKELRQAYQKNREANSRSGSEPRTCCFYDELHAMLGGAATSTPTLCFDSVNGESRNTQAVFGDEEDSSQKGSGETAFPNSQDMFFTLDLEPVTPEPTQGMLPDPEGGEGTSAANVSPLQRLAKIRRRKNALGMKCSLSFCCPPALTEHSRMRGGRQCQSAGEHNMNARRGGGLKMIGGVSLLTEGKSRCSGCWKIKLICSSVWLSCRKGSRSTDHCYSPCVTNSPPPKFHSLLTQTPKNMVWASGHPATPPQRIAQATEGWPSISVKVIKF
ncbi:uncharacterized protein LOC128843237 [Malaclemys terrapin pileata]|uniref:uncharacterized protein LOC128843237 n=1 Tax=Malaclemys terrapin pileata TaxID=2991368 RepID=UPI0023A8F693|nr:uncharacterized protein LOC128843237 [Malaclemys terrapin pileata]